MPRPHPLLPALIALAAALPLAAQAPGPYAEEARWIAEAERLESADPVRSLALASRAVSRLQGPEAAPLRVRAQVLRCSAAMDAAPDSLLAFAEAGIADAARARDARALASLRLCRGYGMEAAGKVVEAMEEYGRGVAEGRRLGVDTVTARALLLRGQLHYYNGDFTTAVADLDEAYRIFTRLGEAVQQRVTLNAMANLNADPSVGQYDRALEYYRQVLAANQADGSQRGIATTYFNIGSTLERQGKLREALAHYRRGLEMDVRRGDSAEVAVDRRAVGIVLYKLGRADEALRLFDQVLAYAVGSEDAELAAQAHLSRGVALRMLGRGGEALAELERARAHFTRTGNQRFLERVHGERALAHALGGAWREAYAARGEQMAIQRALGEEAREEQSSRLRVRFDVDRKEAENRALLRENALRRQAEAAAERVHALQVAVIVLSVVVIAVLVLLIARQVANARRLRETALTDELTGLPNRRHLFLLADAVVRSARSRGPGFSVLALDVDHFKSINDRFGHEAGDHVLRRVAEATRGALREGDHLGRVGGEEFTAVLPGAPAEAAAQVAERLRAAVERTDLSDVAPGLAVTISVGIAVWEPADVGFAPALRRADESLYRAKAAGRNRVEIAPAA